MSNETNQIHWDLSDLYPSLESEAFKTDKHKLREKANVFIKNYRGRIADLDAKEFHQVLLEYEDIYDLISKIGSYVYLSWSVNTLDEKLGKALAEINELGSEISQNLVFFTVEWLKVGEEEAAFFINDKKLSKYHFYLTDSRKYKSHTLEEIQEQVLAAKAPTGKQAWVRYFDETFGAATFTLDGNELSEQEVLSKLHEPDRKSRKRAAQSVTDTLSKLSRSLTYIFNIILLDKSTNDKLRKYPDWITSRNLSNQIEDKTVDTLINSVVDNYSLVHRYYKLKSRLLKIDDFKDYDRYAPILSSSKRITWSQAREMVSKSYHEFDLRMGDIVDMFFDRSWIDASMAKGKRSGAYSASTAASAHPYVFMNYDGKIRDVQTLAHELGHGVHQYLSKDQGELLADTPLTTAETASVFGEMLVFQSLLKEIDDPLEKIAMLISKIDDTIATVFRQISMNRFENEIHNTRRKEGELSTAEISDKWMKTQRLLYGDSVELTDNYALWWSYIPHFLHTPGYVYAYAFGELLVMSLYELYKKGYPDFNDAYINLLKAGGSDKPENLISAFGLDINSTDFWQNGINVLERMISEVEQMVERVEL